MSIEYGTLNPASVVPIGVGLTGACRAIVYIGGLAEKCVVKKIPDQAIAAESFCSVLAAALQLPVLEPVVVTDPRDQSRWFGARELPYPSLGTFLASPSNPSTTELQVLAGILFQWANCPYAISFDQLVLNGDRNVGNLLWDGKSFTLIDHERALGLFPMQSNKLAQLLSNFLPSGQAMQLTSNATVAAIQHQINLDPAHQVCASISQHFSAAPAELVAHITGFETLVSQNASALPAAVTAVLSPVFHGANP